MLVVEDLEVHYRRIAAVRKVSLEASPSEAVSVLGPNGAGKSTLLKTIAGLLKPSAGTITLDGRSLIGERPEEILRRGIALVPEGGRVLSSLTVGENLKLGMTVRGDPADLELMLARFPVLRRKFRTSAGALSGGERQQVALARALLSRPRLLLLDEPTRGLAPNTMELVYEVLEDLRESACSILLVEQYAAKAIAFAERTYVLRTGRVVLAGSRSELANRDELAAAYLGG